MASTEEVHYGMKKLGLRNWREPEVPINFPGLTEEVWVPAVLKPKLTSNVPEDVVRLFEVARGSILYGWFFYPLLTMAEQQLYRVQEAAVRQRCTLAGIPISETRKGRHRDRAFSELINDLGERGIIPPDATAQWDAVRRLRNSSSHPKSPVIMPPGAAISGIDATARQINQLFADNPDYFSLLGTRVRRATGIDKVDHDQPIVVGIDVGGVEKGFHLVALHGPKIVGVTETTDPFVAAQWCKEHNAALVGVDAPCGWSAGESKSREAEKMLRVTGHSAHATPSRARATEIPFYAWMLNGEKLYQALAVEFPLYRGDELLIPASFETYPYLAACAFAGRRLQASDKKTDRRDIVRSAGIDDQLLSNIDYLDAAICALVGYSVNLDYCTAYGDEAGGFILSPPLH